MTVVDRPQRVIVRVAPDVAAGIDPSSRELRGRIGAEIEGLKRRLGIPGAVTVEVTAQEEPTPPIELELAGRRYRCPLRLLGYLRQDVATDAFVVAASGAIVSHQPSLLMDDAAAAAYAQRLADVAAQGGSWRPSELRASLGRVVDQWISLVDVRAVAAALLEASDDPVEELVSRLKPATLDIEMPPALLRRLTSGARPEDADVFVTARGSLLDELGVHLPDMRFVEAVDLEADRFCFRIRSLRTPSVRALSDDRLLADITPDDAAALEISAEPAVEPFTGRAMSSVTTAAAADMEARGVSTWTPMAHVAVALSRAARDHAHRLLDRDVVTADLELLAERFPAVVDRLREVATAPQLTGVLRRLAQERVSVRNLLLIVSAIAAGEDPAFTAAGARATGWDEDAVIRRTRRALRWQLHEQHTISGTDTILGWVLEPTLEALVVNDMELGGDRLVDAIRSALVEPAGPWFPALLTSGSRRGRVAAVIACELPEVPVLGLDELVPSANLELISRLRVPDAEAAVSL